MQVLMPVRISRGRTHDVRFPTSRTDVGGRYQVPLAPGYTTQMRPESLARYAFPGGAAWSGLAAG